MLALLNHKVPSVLTVLDLFNIVNNGVLKKF